MFFLPLNWVQHNNSSIGGQKDLRFKRAIFLLIILLMSSIPGLGVTNVPIEVGVAAVLAEGGNAIDNSNATIKVKLKSGTTVLWRKHIRG